MACAPNHNAFCIRTTCTRWGHVLDRRNPPPCEYLFIGLLVPCHLHVDTRTKLERNHAVLDGADYSGGGNPTVDNDGGNISRMMICRVHRLQGTNSRTRNDSLERQTSVHYDVVYSETNPFPEPFLLEHVNSEQHDESETAIGRWISGQLQAGWARSIRGNSLRQPTRTRISSEHHFHLVLRPSSLRSRPRRRSRPSLFGYIYKTTRRKRRCSWRTSLAISSVIA